jgi:hypothetical protein
LYIQLIYRHVNWVLYIVCLKTSTHILCLIWAIPDLMK